MSHRDLPYRLAVASRALAAIVGGYALTTVIAVFLARVSPQPPAESVMTAMLLSFLIYTAAVLWVFAARSATRAWMGLAVPGVVLGALAWLLRMGAAP